MNTFGLDRFEMIDYYTRFKAACLLSSGSYNRADLDMTLGIDFDIFRFGIPEMSLENKVFVDQLF